MLTEAYGWFTEGFDTADLRDAKRLLDELSSATMRIHRATSPAMHIYEAVMRHADRTIGGHSCGH